MSLMGNGILPTQRLDEMGDIGIEMVCWTITS